MKRREFIKTAAVGGAASAIAMPAIAQSAPEVKWRLTSSFPKSLDTIFGGAETFAKAVSESTDGKFQIQVFAAGEIVPGLQALDAVQSGTVEACQSALYYYWGKDPTMVFATTMPFGMNARQTNSWFYQGGGIDLLNEVFAKMNFYALPAANTGAQMGGWFRKEIKTVADLQGLKFRIGGYAGHILKKMGAVPQQIAPADIYPALEKGALDAVEFIGPYDDEKLGFNKVAPFYYYPGWWDGCAAGHVCFNLQKYNELPKAYQKVLHNAAMVANLDVQAKYDFKNPQALKRLVAAGTQLRAFSPEILDASYKVTQEALAETASQNADFKKVMDSYVAFRNDQYLWWQVAEYPFDNYMIRARSRG